MWQNYKEKKYENLFPFNFVQNLCHLKFKNYGSTNGFSKEVVPHYIKLHKKNHSWNHNMRDKLGQWDPNTSSNIEAQTQSAFWSNYLRVPLVTRC
jgi:hypothetical protein